MSAVNTQAVTYRSSTLLSCRCEQDAEVIICLDPARTLSGAPYLEGTLTTFTETQDTCGNPLYAYYLQYDANLLDPITEYLLSTEVLGVICKGCLIDYIDWKTRAVSKGLTAARPTVDLYIGQMYLDTTLDADGLPIWWNGVKWIRADGSDA